MEEIIKSIKDELHGKYLYANTLVLEVLFSKGHISCSILIEGRSSNAEISVQKTLKIAEYVRQFTKENINRMIVTLTGNEVSENFDFSSNIFVTLPTELKELPKLKSVFMMGNEYNRKEEKFEEVDRFVVDLESKNIFVR